MGKTGRAIVDLNVKDLIDDLNSAIADEWLAAYQYWITSIVAKGLAAEEVAELMKTQVQDELGHAGKLAQRVTELGGTPVTDPKEWAKISKCGYAPPPKNTRDARAMVRSALETEACAIKNYNTLLKKTFGKDIVTYNLIATILQEEVHEEEQLENLI